MVNIISPRAQSTLRSTYYLRLLTTTLVALACTTLIGLALLLPSYFLIHAEADEAARYVETQTAIADQHTKSQATDTLNAFNEKINLLATSAHTPAFAHVLSLAVQPLPRAVSIDTIDMEFKTDGAVVATFSGTAGTRGDLIAYAEALKKVQEFKNVTLPVSDLVAEKGNPFKITATYTPTGVAPTP